MIETKKNKNSASEQELEKAVQQFENFDNQVKEMTMDRMNMAPKQEVEPQTKLSQKEIEKMNDIYLKPKFLVLLRINSMSIIGRNTMKQKNMFSL